ncbi:hypothetical protein V6N13_119296 [Hibiscus sabdariffa]
MEGELERRVRDNSISLHSCISNEEGYGNAWKLLTVEMYSRHRYHFFTILFFSENWFPLLAHYHDSQCGNFHATETGVMQYVRHHTENNTNVSVRGFIVFHKAVRTRKTKMRENKTTSLPYVMIYI